MAWVLRFYNSEGNFTDELDLLPGDKRGSVHLGDVMRMGVYLDWDEPLGEAQERWRPARRVPGRGGTQKL